ncbi:hypothetical protein OXIME_000543 [Oxyplasma meridianum]|uniref:3-octaprenyl-4-hydroxybenzoate carboxy-lyase-like C-terminal domain-containing protein n=1 Tax=Oxyplasma meridianum TaxID=3073602 RepID=A0AAX4NEV1_9ARCH
MYIISSDITSDPDRTAGKLLFPTSGKQRKIVKDSNREKMEIVFGDSKVVISHEMYEDGKLNLQIGEDIDLTDLEKVGWALATRINPQYDMEVRNNKICMKVIKSHPEIPAISPEIMDKVRKKCTTLFSYYSVNCFQCYYYD